MLVAIRVSLLSIGGVAATAIYQLSLAHEAEFLEEMAVLDAEFRRSPLTSSVKISGRERNPAGNFSGKIPGVLGDPVTAAIRAATVR